MQTFSAFLCYESERDTGSATCVRRRTKPDRSSRIASKPSMNAVHGKSTKPTQDKHMKKGVENPDTGRAM